MSWIRPKENNPGNLNKRIELLYLDSEDNKAGGRRSETLQWLPFAKVWANITNLSGGESFDNNQQKAELTHRIIIRYRKDVTRENRIKFGDRIFRIGYIVNQNEANRFLQLHVMEEV